MARCLTCSSRRSERPRFTSFRPPFRPQKKGVSTPVSAAEEVVPADDCTPAVSPLSSPFFDLRRSDEPLWRAKQEAILGRPLADGCSFEDYPVLTGQALRGALRREVSTSGAARRGCFDGGH